MVKFNCSKPANIRSSVSPPRNRIQPVPAPLSAPAPAPPAAYPSIIFCDLKNPATRTCLCFLEHMATLINNFLSLARRFWRRGADACVFCIRHRYWDGVMPSPLLLCPKPINISRGPKVANPSTRRCLPAPTSSNISDLFPTCSPPYFTKLSLRFSRVFANTELGRGLENRSALGLDFVPKFPPFESSTHPPSIDVLLLVSPFSSITCEQNSFFANGQAAY
jgi:hypothetical protein